MSTGPPGPRHAGTDRRDERVVPVFAVTGGRTRPTGGDLPLESLVSATDRAAAGGDLQQEYREILGLAGRPVSVVELGAHLQVPVGVARVLVGDLADAGYLIVHAPAPTSADGRPTPEILNRLLEGLRAR